MRDYLIGIHLSPDATSIQEGIESTLVVLDSRSLYLTDNQVSRKELRANNNVIISVDLFNQQVSRKELRVQDNWLDPTLTINQVSRKELRDFMVAFECSHIRQVSRKELRVSSSIFALSSSMLIKYPGRN